MNYTINELKEKSIPLPITYEARRIADNFAAQQPTRSKKRQVYLNTLAVCVANNYMEMMGIPTDLKGSDSWNPVLRLCDDVADLKLALLGHLECRPIETVSEAESETVLCHLSEEMLDDRIGCLIIEMDLVRKRANLLGFVKELSTTSVVVRQLLSMGEFPKYLGSFSDKNIEQPDELVNLSQWLNHIFEAGWQPSVKSLLNPRMSDLSLGLRGAPLPTSASEIVGGKLIKVGSRLAPKFVFLAISLNPGAHTPKVEIIVKLKPEDEQAYLPRELHIKVLDETGIECMLARSDGDSSSIELHFDAMLGERFSISIGLEGVNVSQKFCL